MRLWVITVAVTALANAESRTIQVLRIDGTSLQAQWTGATSTELQLSTGAGEIELSLDDLSSVRFAPSRQRPEGDVVFHLADGGRLFGGIASGESDAVVADVTVAPSLRLPFRALAGVRLVQGEEHAKSAELFDAALQSRLPGQDVLITRGPEEVKALRGRLQALDPQQGAFVFGDRLRTFQNEKIYGVVFAAGVGKPPVHSLTLELTDGSSFSGELEQADTRSVRLSASFGAQIELSLDNVAKLSIRNPRVQYLSDLKPGSQHVEGIVHRPWPIRTDRSVSARPLSIAGRVFDKGLGVHSLTRLTYDIEGAYETFVATIGIDDAVRPLGSVVFKVSGDGRELFDSGKVRGTDEPRDIRVGVAGIKSLTLTVDYGQGLDVSDHADWGGARLLRPSSSTATERER